MGNKTSKGVREGERVHNGGSDTSRSNPQAALVRKQGIHIRWNDKPENEKKELIMSVVAHGMTVNG